MSFLLPSDYQNGTICIAVNSLIEPELQSYIDTFEKIYLQDLLGCNLYDLFIDDLDSNVPQTPRFSTIFNELCFETYCGIELKSLGIKEMLKRFIYWEWERKNRVKNTITGNRVNENEVSREASFASSDIYQVYNEGIDTYKAIQSYICKNESDYSDFKGKMKEKTSWL